MALKAPAQRKLKLQAPVLKKEKDPAFYIVPPVLIAVVYAFCAFVPHDVKPQTPAATAAKPAATAKVDRESAPARSGVALAWEDPNTALPEYTMPAGCENVLEGVAGVSVSAAGTGAPAGNAVDGSCENDGHVAVANPAGGENAWWQVEAQDGQPFSGERIVIYGGGSRSIAGKLVGGFRVEVAFAGGETISREFCQPGFALEGHETWELGGQQSVQSIRVSALKADAPVVLREVQLIGPAR